MEYYLYSDAGDEVSGPYNEQALLGLLHDGSASSSDLISTDQEEWYTLGDCIVDDGEDDSDAVEIDQQTEASLPRVLPPPPQPPKGVLPPPPRVVAAKAPTAVATPESETTPDKQAPVESGENNLKKLAASGRVRWRQVRSVFDKFRST